MISSILSLYRPFHNHPSVQFPDRLDGGVVIDASILGQASPKVW